MGNMAALIVLVALASFFVVVSSSSTMHNSPKLNTHSAQQASHNTLYKDSVILRGGSQTKRVLGSEKKQLKKKVQDSEVDASPLVSGIKNALASGFAAACVKTALQPFDTLKTVQQQVVLSAGNTIESGGMSLTAAAESIIARPGGYLNLYSGLGITVLGSMPSVGLYFGVYQYSKKVLTKKFKGSKKETDINVLAIAASAAIGNSVASFARVPYEVVKQRLQAGVYPSTVNAIVSMYKKNGVREFYPLNGVGVQMMRDVPYAIMTLITYEILQKKWVNKHRQEDLGGGGGKGKGKHVSWRDMTAGAIAGGVGSLLSNPMDVIKTRIQTNPGLYSGIYECAKTTLEKEGVRAFMRGSKPRLLHKIPANGVFFLSYEFFRRLLGVTN